MTFDLLRLAAPKPVIVPFAKTAGLKPLVAGQAATASPRVSQSINSQPINSQPINSQSSDQVMGLVVQWQGAPLNAEFLPSRHSADYLVAMHDLVKRVAQQQTQALPPDQILPSVAEAAEAAVLKQSDWRAAPVNQPELAQQTAEWKPLVASLLWRLAQSTHEALHLIEGQQAQVAEAGQWQSGVLRLVVLLDLAVSQGQQAQAGQAFDLVMAQPAPDLLPTARLLKIKSLLGQQPMSVAAYLQQLTRQFITAAPILRAFFEGYSANWLMPQQDWQAGTLKLKLGLAFSPERLDLPPAPQPLITFSQPHWLEQHVSVAVAQQLTQILLQVPPAADIADTPETIVKRAETAIQDLQNSLTLASRTFAQQAVTLDELAFRLLWGINRTAYEVMQLTSGLPVRLLQPHQIWTGGLLRLALYLELRTPQQHWQFDLARRVNAAPSPPLPTSALIQSHSHLWCLQPIQLSHLEAQFWQQIEQLAPEIALLRASTEITLTAGEMQGQLGVVQLKAGFELS